MGEEKIEEIIRRIEEAIDGKREIEEVRKSDTLKFFLAVLENLKDWSGIEEVKNWINNFLEGKKNRFSGDTQYLEIHIVYKNKFFFSIAMLPSTEEASKQKQVTDYLVFKWRENEEIWFGITIPPSTDKKIKIGFYNPYAQVPQEGGGKGKTSKNRQFNEEAKKLNLWEEMDIEISQEFPQKVAEKMGEILEEGIKKEEKLKELANKLFKEIEEKTSPGEILPPNSRLSSILNAIQTKPFLILAGISGTGKTQIARLIAWAMSEENNNKKEG
jgi:hypothetical protein